MLSSQTLSFLVPGCQYISIDLALSFHLFYYKISIKCVTLKKLKVSIIIKYVRTTDIVCIVVKEKKRGQKEDSLSKIWKSM